MPRNYMGRVKARKAAAEQKPRQYKCQGCGLHWPQYGKLCRHCWEAAGKPRQDPRPGGYEELRGEKVPAADLEARPDKITIVDGVEYLVAWDGS